MDAFCQYGCILSRGQTKTTPDETFQTKNPGKPPNKNPRELTQTLCKDMYACVYY